MINIYSSQQSNQENGIENTEENINTNNSNINSNMENNIENINNNNSNINNNNNNSNNNNMNNGIISNSNCESQQIENSIYSGNENYMIVSRVLSNNDFLVSNGSNGNLTLTASGNYIPIVNNNNINLNTSLPPTPPIPPQYGYGTLTPTNSDSDSDYSDCLLPDINRSHSNDKSLNNDNNGYEDSEEDGDEDYEERDNQDDTYYKVDNCNKYINVNNNKKSNPININQKKNKKSKQLGIDDFEIIEIEEENEINGNNTHNSNQMASSNSISPPHQSPFKQLLTNKLRSIKDKIENSPSEKYNTFPTDRFNNIPTSDIILYSSPLHNNDHSAIKGSGGLLSHHHHITNGNLSFSPIIDNKSYSNNNIEQNYSSSFDAPNTPLNINNISPSSSITKDTFDTDSQYSTSNNNIILDSNSNNNDFKQTMYNNSSLIRGYSNSSITRPVSNYEKSKVNYKILILLSLSVFFSVSNLYYAQPLLNEIGKISGEDTPLPYGITSLVTMSVQIGYALGLLFISILSEVMSKKKLTLVLSMINCAALVGIGLSTHIAMVIVFHFIVGVSTIIPYIAVPLALDMTPNPSDRGNIVSVLLSSVFVGLLGARVTSGVIGFLFGWRVVFYFAAITMFIISLLLFYFLPYTPRNQNIIPYNKLLLSTWEFLKKEKTLRQTSFIGSMVFATFSILWTTLSYRLNDEPYQYNSGFIGLFGLIGMAGAIASPISGRIAERFGINRLMVIYIFICALGYFILMFFDFHIVGLIFGIFILDLGVQSCHISNQSRNNQIAIEESSKYSMNTIYMASYLIGGSIGSGISGVIYSHWNWSGSSVVALIFLGLALTCHLITFEKPFTHSLVNNNNNNNNNNENHDIVQT
ncbi:hypothetical protein DICPUDRAFT_84754 [Dictyostelium purpureum]|uniref:Major facilitator superfamily (MFS) profile domain-containing protein n=1 Tax=Dictyostelium purpureum TaxID=5786 RepID=F1A3M6_DICPU|nr:uncharacterized protein DICPUDRAFT_84754 [Dictyostelium purpureum]EGC29199.1 hypothetical protein DICPUDRAFT_84754 [Dictyostelium purpureum]|eukprot:XP_003294270.1 hypothetical protein DICPUDRAFT_84754 [Dictyostelium purpureum]